jgi:hypothetical protein
MKRPRSWIRWFLLLLLVLVIVEAAALTWVAPYFLIRRLEAATAGALQIGSGLVSFPPAATFLRVRSSANSPYQGVSIQRLALRPQWMSFPNKTLWLKTIELERPFVRFSRTAEGAIQWPLGSSPQRQGARAWTWNPFHSAAWRVRVDSLKLTDGVVEFVDARPSQPFRGALQHVSIELGPVALPPDDQATSLIIRGEAVGSSAEAAPFYCSGWLNPVAGDVEVFCKLEPMGLAAFGPYYDGRIKVRPYQARLSLASQWTSKGRVLDGHIRVEIDRLTEGDVSVRGRTVLDAKRLVQGEAVLRSAFRVVGPMEAPEQWRVEFVPGDPQVRDVLGLLIEHGVRMVRIPAFGRTLHVALVPSGEAAYGEVLAASRAIDEALEVLAPPAPETVPLEPAPVAPEAATEPVVPEMPSAPISPAQPQGAVPPRPAAPSPAAH